MSLKQMQKNFSFPEEEKKIQLHWKNNDTYKELLDLRKNNKTFKFMDGPPFVSSDNLHYGHILVAYIKDTILKYKMMKGYNAPYKIGYDCHGLPIEQVVEKKLGLKTKKEVEEFGIDNYNKECKSVIQSFSGAWQGVYNRMGRWVDFENEYKTLDINFMESVWWVFNQLWNKDLVYKGYKIMAFSTSCATALSNFEAKQNYKDVTDMSVYVKFSLVNKINTYLTVWTTTPWTLPSNLALCVNPNLDYLEVTDLQDNATYIVAKDAIHNLYKKSKKQTKPLYKIIREFKGSELKDIEYTPLFDYFIQYNNQLRTFKIITDSFVTATDGTGIVHLAPSFGEVDLEVCIKNNILDICDVGDYCPIDDDGRFTDPVLDYIGVHYLTANLNIINSLKINKQLIKKVPVTHNYPYCWRTDTPLIYRAVSGLFIKVTSIKDKIIANNHKVKWIPENAGSGRFHQWLKNTRDWGVSRSRFFGTPIPVWISDDGEEMICVQSIDELVDLANLEHRPTDLHREFMDKIKIPSKQGKGMLTRIPDVFDCWFESGSVPYAQIHYPFQNKHIFQNNMEPLSDFICEGIDQTRGWFYTLMVLSTALFDVPAFKNVICSGLILGEDGTKLSKRLANYVNPYTAFQKYGSDAIRLYLISSPAAKAGSFKFNEDDIMLVSKRINQWYNGLKFFLEHSIKFQKDGHTIDINLYNDSDNIMDKWILARLNTVITNISSSLDDFVVYDIYKEVLGFIEDLTNWYIKFNRMRLNGKKCTFNDQHMALSTLYKVLLEFSKVTAPLTPFLSETMYLKLSVLLKNPSKSVHLCDFPTTDSITIDSDIERKMKNLQEIASSVRSLRRHTKNATSAKVTLNSVTIATDNNQLIDDLKELNVYLLEEINSLKITYLPTIGLVKYKATTNRKNIGQRFKKQASEVANFLNELDQDTLRDIYNKTNQIIMNKYILIKDVDFYVTTEDNHVLAEFEHSSVTSGNLIIINAEYTKTVDELYKKKLFIRSIQELRKINNLHPWDPISIYYGSENNQLLDIINNYSDIISNDLDKPIYQMHDLDSTKKIIANEICSIDGIDMRIIII